MKEKEYQHQIDMVKLQHENELKTNEENMKNHSLIFTFFSVTITL